MKRTERFVIVGVGPASHSPHAVTDLANFPFAPPKSSIVHFVPRTKSRFMNHLSLRPLKCPMTFSLSYRFNLRNTYGVCDLPLILTLGFIPVNNAANKLWKPFQTGLKSFAEVNGDTRFTQN